MFKTLYTRKILSKRVGIVGGVEGSVEINLETKLEMVELNSGETKYRNKNCLGGGVEK